MNVVVFGFCIAVHFARSGRPRSHIYAHGTWIRVSQSLIFLDRFVFLEMPDLLGQMGSSKGTALVLRSSFVIGYLLRIHSRDREEAGSR